MLFCFFERETPLGITDFAFQNFKASFPRSPKGGAGSAARPRFGAEWVQRHAAALDGASRCLPDMRAVFLGFDPLIEHRSAKKEEKHTSENQQIHPFPALDNLAFDSSFDLCGPFDNQRK